MSTLDGFVFCPPKNELEHPLHLWGVEKESQSLPFRTRRKTRRHGETGRCEVLRVVGLEVWFWCCGHWLVVRASELFGVLLGPCFFSTSADAVWAECPGHQGSY